MPMKNRTISKWLAASFFMVIALSTLTGCSALTLQQTCDSVRAELEDIAAIPRTEGDDYTTWPSGFATHNASRSSRSIAQSDILVNFPFARELVETVKSTLDPSEIEGKTYLGTIFRGVSSAYILERVTEGTSNEIHFTPSEVAQLTTGKANLLEAKEAFLEDCADSNDLGGTNWLYRDTVKEVSHALHTYLEIEICSEVGKFAGSVCADSDYSSGYGIDVFLDEPQNPFNSKHSDPRVQEIAEVVWCVNQGSLVNQTRTGCK